MTKNHQANRRGFIAGASAAALTAQAHAALSATAVTIGEDVLHGRQALVIQNDRMRLSALPGGGFIGEARLKSADPKAAVNPMRVPHYQTIDPYTYDLRKDAARYGDGMQRRLMSGYMGQFTCFPHFGASSAAEFRQDYAQHGELVAVRWTRAVGGPANTLTMRAELPLTQFGFERRISLNPGETVAYVEETAQNLVSYDRPVQWVEHTAFGPPFVTPNRTWADAPVANAIIGRGAAATRTDWPTGRDAQGGQSDFRAFTGKTTLWQLRQDRPKAYFTLYSSDFNLLIGYLFDAAETPWILDYQENQRVTEKPWDGKVIMRGLCFGDSALTGLRNAVAQGTFMGAPTASWIDAKGARTKRYAIFLTEIPAGFRGVEDVQTGAGAITITERDTRRQIVLPAASLS
jgi:hypothetical protein